MPFSVVTWTAGDELSSAKLAQMVENLTLHDHRADGTQGAPRARWLAGQATIAAAANASTFLNVAFPAGFFEAGGVVPTVIVNPRTSTDASTVLRSWGCRYPNWPTSESVDLFVHRTVAGSVALDWIAVQAPP